MINPFYFDESAATGTAGAQETAVSPAPRTHTDAALKLATDVQVRGAEDQGLSISKS